MKDRSRTVVFVGAFDDHFYRIPSYINACASLGFSSNFVSSADFLEHYADFSGASVVVFNDEPAIRSVAATLGTGDENSDPRIAKAVVLSSFTDKHLVRRISSSEFPHRFTASKRDDLDMALVSSSMETSTAVVIKPTVGSCAVGVKKCTSVRQVANYVSKLSSDDEVMVEEYIDGDHFCLDVTWNGRAASLVGFCWKVMSFAQTPYIIGHSLIEPIPSELVELVVKKISSILTSHCSGIAANFHCELVLGSQDGKPHLIEINPRAPGGWLPELYSVGVGRSYDLELVRNAAGLPPMQGWHHTPAALGSIVNSDFFENETKQKVRSSSIYERFTSDGISESGKIGRFLFWGQSSEQVALEFQATLEASMPLQEPDEDKIAAAVVSSKCC
ncbi:ATP-grasp domain-containing protein [Gymnodinialimonas sp.]